WWPAGWPCSASGRPGARSRPRRWSKFRDEMKELTGSASGTTPASPQECLALLEAIDAYPSWAGDVVKQAEVLERDGSGHPTRARTRLHVERGPLTRDFDLLFDVKVDPGGTVALNRVPHEGSDKERFDVIW